MEYISHFVYIKNNISSSVGCRSLSCLGITDGFIDTWFHTGHISIKAFNKEIACLLAYMEMSYPAEAWWWIYNITETQYTIQLIHMEQRADEQITVKPVYNAHLMGYFSAFWSSSKWPRAT